MNSLFVSVGFLFNVLRSVIRLRKILTLDPKRIQIHPYIAKSPTSNSEIKVSKFSRTIWSFLSIISTASLFLHRSIHGSTNTSAPLGFDSYKLHRPAKKTEENRHQHTLLSNFTQKGKIQLTFTLFQIGSRINIIKL